MRNTDVLPAATVPSSRLDLLARFGRAMNRSRKTIATIQWGTVALYLALLLVPLFLPHPDRSVSFTDDFVLLSRFLLWGVGWPLIMLSMMLAGRAWCGVFCPDGTLTEFFSRHGRNRTIPRWMRWPGWSFVMLATTTVWGQLLGVYGFAPASLLLLGLPTLGAMLTGWLYGRGRRVWCMYLCPANGVMSLLARVSPMHFRVDQDAWKRHAGPPPRIDCAPLINIRQMKSASACHACGRCAGYMDAVDLAARLPAAEILGASDKEVPRWEALTLVFGLIGICTAALLWKSSALFANLRALLGNWLHGVTALRTDAPWWLLANYPEAGPVYTLADGLCILVFILGGGALLGLAVLMALKLAAWLGGDPADWRRLSLALIPAAGGSMVLGLSSQTVATLRAEGLALSWAEPAQALALAAASLFSLWLGMRLQAAIRKPHPARRLTSLVAYAVTVVILHHIWTAGLF